MEIRDVVGFEGRYRVSDAGEVFGFRFGVPLKPNPTHNGYHKVALRKNGRYHHCQVHRLVMAAFVGPIPDGMQVNHKNLRRDDNRLANLEYVTPSQNQRHAFANGGGHHKRMAI